jgi:hypothetical protein
MRLTWDRCPFPTSPCTIPVLEAPRSMISVLRGKGRRPLAPTPLSCPRLRPIGLRASTGCGSLGVRPMWPISITCLNTAYPAIVKPVQCSKKSFQKSRCTRFFNVLCLHRWTGRASRNLQPPPRKIDACRGRNLCLHKRNSQRLQFRPKTMSPLRPESRRTLPRGLLSTRLFYSDQHHL